jgi:hypothetical protein
MNVTLKTVAFLFLCTVAVVAQQPNTGSHSMTINGIDGPPFPIINNPVRTAAVATFAISGFPNQPYAIFQGNLGTGTTFLINGIVDLALNPFPVAVVDGFQNPFFNTGPTGAGGFQVNVPPTGTPPTGVPVGLQLALQCLIGDPANSPYAVSLTAATKIQTVQGPIIAYYTLGDDSSVVVSPAPMTIPFYGTSYSSFNMCSNGFLTFGAADTDYTPTAAEMNSGPARFSAFWCDLTCGANQVKTTLDNNPGPGVPAYIRVDFNQVVDLGFSVTHNFSMVLRADGSLDMIHASSNNASQYDEITGIGPGLNLGSPQVQTNFVGAQPPGSSVGPGILTTSPFGMVGGVYQSFFEWFGNSSMPYYGNGYDNNYDMPGVTVHFQPAGSGSLPGASNKYFVY